MATKQIMRCKKCKHKFLNKKNFRICPACGNKNVFIFQEVTEDDYEEVIEYTDTGGKLVRKKVVWSLYDRSNLVYLAERLGMDHDELLYRHATRPVDLNRLILAEHEILPVTR